MPRAPFQILVLPYRETECGLEFAVFSRSDYACRQGIAGGGEDYESPLKATKRESFEEAGIPVDACFMPLQATCSVPVCNFEDGGAWEKSLYVISEYSFGVDCTNVQLVLSAEHEMFEWLSYEKAHARLTYDSNRTALWELNLRLNGRGPRE